MSTSIYDSRAFVKRLTEAGMTEGQADTLANENLLLIAEHLATKEDFRAMSALIEDIRAEMVTSVALRAEIAALENKLLVKLGGLMLALATVITAILGTLIALN